MFPQQYYQGPNATSTLQYRKRTVNELIPNSFPGLLGAIQLFLWISIIILEIMSIYYDAGRGTIYAGLWCSIVFFMTWVSMFCYLCCGKSRGCGHYIFIQNIINLFFAIVLLSFTARFVENPCLCYGILCHVPNWDYFTDTDYEDHHMSSCNDRTYRKIPILKGLLACAVLMVVCNIAFIVTYFIISIRLRIKAKSDTHTPEVMYQQQAATVRWSEQATNSNTYMNYPPQQPQQPHPATSPWPSAPPAYDLVSEKF